MGRGKTDVHSCNKFLAEAGADQMLLQTGQEERKQVSCFKHINFLNHRSKDHDCHLCWLELPGVHTPLIGKKETTEHPLQITFPTLTTRESADWCLVLSQDFFSEEWLFSWKEKSNHFFPVFQCLHLDQCAPEIVLLYKNLCLLPI